MSDIIPTHNATMEAIVNTICCRTDNEDKAFFRPVVAYFLSKIASNMRATLVTQDMGTLPINNYSICLGPSGYGKGHSINIIEDEFLSGFKNRFMNEVMPAIVKQNIEARADSIAALQDADPTTISEFLQASYKRAGEFVFNFDSGTIPAIKQLRNKLILGGIGALSSEQDELGSNLSSNSDLLTLFLELYDLGKVKQKLIKNTAENQRDMDLEGRVPTNLLMFGTPAKLFDGDEVERKFFEFLDTGYARRCLFGFGTKTRSPEYFTKTPEEHFNNKIRHSSNEIIKSIYQKLASLANEDYYNQKITVPKEVSYRLISYRLDCERTASSLQNHEFIKRAELEHRYFKTLKLAGVFAFIEQHTTMTLEDLEQAILLVEECGKSFSKFLNREPNYVRLAKFIAGNKVEVTNADINEALPWYSTQAKRKELLLMAKAWGYKHNILIKQEERDGVEFFSGSMLELTDINKLTFSYSTDFADGYKSSTIKFSKMKSFFVDQTACYNWCNHSFKDSHRKRDNVLKGFNVIVLDIDTGFKIANFKELFKDITYFLHTTKRHMQDEKKTERYRVVIPIKYKLDLTPENYKEFMTNILKWLPFDVDEHSCLAETKWATYYGAQYYSNEGELFDPLPFIPRTSRNDELKAQRAELKKLDNIQAWFCVKMKEGNRNNMLYRYGAMLLDAGKCLGEVEKLVYKLNDSIELPLTKDEIDTTVLASLRAKAAEIAKNDPNYVPF